MSLRFPSCTLVLIDPRKPASTELLVASSTRLGMDSINSSVFFIKFLTAFGRFCFCVHFSVCLIHSNTSAITSTALYSKSSDNLVEKGEPFMHITKEHIAYKKVIGKLRKNGAPVHEIRTT